MALITRVSRLFQADLHAVLDRIEEPDLLLRQAVREMEDELTRQQQQIQTLEHEQGELKNREMDMETRLKEIEQELDICFKSGQEELARTVVKRKLEAERYLKHLRKKEKRLTQTLSDLRSRQDENRARLQSMRQKAELFAHESTADQSEASWNQPAISISTEEVEVAFLGEREKRSAT